MTKGKRNEKRDSAFQRLTRGLLAVPRDELAERMRQQKQDKDSGSRNK